ncbi:hypothetical protein QA612_14150 [Evansella sp. AB-P1]|uniref:hypothetical protein n=1 Tax=Evansella sp. AB-P1 TaxID=3037653 RepID=UPI00241E3E84|nr:hypothetical protein [Evansella sp. AB-P1]MDG5788621.1 hypothetical protein [Evansella sp. AB-P1]
MNSKQNDQDRIKLKAFRNAYISVFVIYLFTVILNDVVFQLDLDYRYIFSITVVSMVVVFYFTIFLEKKNTK